MAKKDFPKGWDGTDRKKKTGKIRFWGVVAAGVGVAVAVGAAAAWWGGTRESLPPEEAVIRDFEIAFRPEHSTLDRLHKLQRSLRVVRALPPERRRSLLAAAMLSAAGHTLEDFSRLPPGRKPERARELCADAVRSLDYFRKLPRKKQELVRKLVMEDPAARAAFDNTLNIVTNRLSPSDREMTGPVIKIWKSILDGKN